MDYAKITMQSAIIHAKIPGENDADETIRPPSWSWQKRPIKTTDKHKLNWIQKIEILTL